MKYEYKTESFVMRIKSRDELFPLFAVIKYDKDGLENQIKSVERDGWRESSRQTIERDNSYCYTHQPPTVVVTFVREVLSNKPLCGCNCKK